MSQFERAQPLIGVERNLPGAIPGGPRIQTRDQLQAPGVVPQPPAVTDSFKSARGIMQILGLATDIVGTMGQIAQLSRQEQRRVDAQARGLATIHFGDIESDTRQQFLEGKLGREDIPGLIDQYSEGQSAAYRERTSHHFKSKGRQWSNQFDAAEKARAWAEGVPLGINAVYGAKDINEAVGLIETFAETYDTSTEVAIRSIAIPALRKVEGDQLDVVKGAIEKLSKSDEFAIPIDDAEDRISDADDAEFAAQKQDMIDTAYEQAKFVGPEAGMNTIDAAVKTGALPFREGEKHKQVIVASSQQKWVGLTANRIMTGLTPEATDELRRTIQERSELGPDHPRGITANHRGYLLSMLIKKEQVNESRERIFRRLSTIPGEKDAAGLPKHPPVNLTEEEDGREFANILQDWHFDENGQLIDMQHATLLVNEVAVARMLPKQIVTSLWKDATYSSNGEKAGLAAWTIGQMSLNNSEATLAFVKKAGIENAPAIWAARDLVGEGKSPNVALAEYRRLQAIDVPDGAPEASQWVKLDDVDMENALAATLDLTRKNVPHVKRTFWNFFDPADPDLPPAIRNMTMVWWKQAYAADRSHQVSKGEAVEHANKHAQAMFRQHIDMILFKDQIIPTIINNFRDNKVAHTSRWGPGFEEEARADFLRAGYPENDWELIVSMAPNWNDPAGDSWVYIVAGGGAYTPSANKIAIWEPSAKLKGENEPYQNTIDMLTAREQEFTTFDPREKSVSQMVMPVEVTKNVLKWFTGK